MLDMKNFSFKYFHLINIALLGFFHLKIAVSACVVTYIFFGFLKITPNLCMYLIPFQLSLPQVLVAVTEKKPTKQQLDLHIQ